MDELQRALREQRRLAYELRIVTQQLPYLRQMVEGSRDALALASEDWLLLEFNTAFQTLFPKTYGGMDLRALFFERPDDIAKGKFVPFGSAGALQAGCIEDGSLVEWVWERKDHHRVLNVRRLSDATVQRRALMRARARIEELDAQLGQERDQERRTRIDALTVIAGSVAHDLNNVLSVVMGNLELLQDTLDTQEQHEVAQDIGEAAKQAQQIAQRFGAFSRGSSVVRVRVPLKPMLTRFMRTYAGAWGGKLPVSLPTEPMFVGADESQLSQVLLNLVTNAFQFAGVNGVSIRGYAKRWQETDGWCIEVLDDGPGIAEADLPRIFDPFFTTRPSGTGLGLASALRIVEAHGGQLTAQNRDVGGTCFALWLPKSVESDDSSVSSRDVAYSQRGSNHTSLEGMNILVMDDDPLVRQTMKRAISLHGARVWAERDGAAAIERYRAICASGHPPLVILDLFVEDGMDGVDTAAALRELDPEAKILACSGHHEILQSSDYRELGFDAFLPKPFLPRELERMLLDLQARRGSNAVSP